MTALTGATVAGTRVSKSRLAPVRAAELPAISVYTDNETAEESIEAPRELKRMINVAIDAWLSVPANGNVDDVFDAIALEIETAMDADITLAGKAGDSILASTEFGIKMDGDRPMGCVHLEYACEYHTDLRAANPADSFNKIDVKYTKLDGTTTINTGNQAHDSVSPIHE